MNNQLLIKASISFSNSAMSCNSTILDSSTANSSTSSKKLTHLY